MVSLDERSGVALDRNTLDHVRIERALREKLRAALDRLQRLLKHFDEGAANDLPLLLGL